MRRTIRALILAFFCAAAPSLCALDLPVKNVNGKAYYYYTVKKGDTLYSLISRLGITRKQLVESNPSAADMLRTGETLYFDVEKFGDGSPVDVEPEEQPDRTPEGYVIHHVKKGETLYGISRQYDVDQEKIVELNPTVRNGLKTGTTLRIPVDAVAEAPVESKVEEADDPTAETEVSREPEVATEIETTAELTPVRPPIEKVGEIVVDETEAETEGESADSVVEDRVERVPSIAVMLPFMLESETPDKHALLYTDFYKGLLLAADTLSNRGDSLKIYAFDTMGDINRLKALLKEDEVAGASVIIAPETDRQLAAIADAVAGSDTKVANVFNVRDSLYLRHPEFVQTNIPHRRMYAKAVDAISNLYPGHVPVILRNDKGRNDKMEFINYLTEYFTSRGIEPIEVAYEGSLASSQLEAVTSEAGTNYLIIPSAGSLAEFNKFIHAVKTVRDAATEENKIAVFGYPDWTAFRGDAETMLHAVGATVYSRFYYDATGFDTRSLNQAFERWYGEEMIDVVPNHGVLGFDVGNWLIRNIRSNGGRFVPDDDSYVGVQSSFDCIRQSDETGYYNDCIYILHFTPDRRVQRLSF